MININCQPFLDRLTHILTNTKQIEQFKKGNSIEDKIKSCLDQIPLKYQNNHPIYIRDEIKHFILALRNESTHHQKCNDKSFDLKEKGSKAFLRKKDKEALCLYSDALRYAPYGSNLCSLLYANRSAALYQMGNYKDCLDDIQRAEASGYPSETLHKILKRKTSCLAHLSRYQEAVDSLAHLKSTLSEFSQKDKTLLDKFSSSIDSLEEEIKNLKFSGQEFEAVSTSLLSTVYKNESNLVSGMSSALEMRHNDTDGRHIIAKEKIPRGSLAFLEKPFACILLPDFFFSHCQKCLKPTANPLPCDDCIDVVWCSEACRHQGNLYHQHECGNLHILTGVGIAHLALRIVLMARFKTCLKIKKEFSSSSQTDSMTSAPFKRLGNESSYTAVYSLLTHLDKVSLEDYMQYCLAAVILATILLDYSPSFVEECIKDNIFGITETREVKLVSLSAILVHHIAQLVSNAHAVTQVVSLEEENNDSFLQVSQNRLASAIYPSASLMNHSCKPSIINSFDKDTLVIHTIEDLEEGQQLYNCYGPHAFRQEREERQEILRRQYFFVCKCPACTEKKFLLKEGNWKGIKCPSCNGIANWKEGPKKDSKGVLHCLECYKVGPPSKDVIDSCSSVSMLINSSEESLSSGYLQEAESDLEDALKLGVKIYSEENMYLNTIRDRLAKVYTMTGRLKDSLRQLSKCIQVIEKRYGSDSVEAAHEFLKYLDILVLESPNDSKISELRSRIDEIFTMHYGAHWKIYLQSKNF